MTAGIPGPSATARSASAVSWSPAEPPVMSNGTATLRWGWSASGLRPTSFEALGAVYTFADGPLWLAEFTPSDDLDDRSTLGPLDVAPVVTQTTDESWSVAWDVGGLSIALTVTLTGAQVEFGIGSATMTGGRRWRSLYGPLVRIETPKATEEDVDTRREERVVTNFWSGSLINEPTYTLANLPGIDPSDPNFVPGFEDANLPGYQGLFTDGPGTYMAEFGGYYDRTNSHALYWQSTDTRGRAKKWIYATEGNHLLVGWQHFPPGITDNSFDLDYAIRFEIVTGLQGRQWLAVAERYRSFIEAQSPPPRWFVPTGWGSQRARDAVFVLTQGIVPDFHRDNPGEIAEAAAAGSHTVRTTGHDDAIVAGKWLAIDVYVQDYFHRIVKVDGDTLTLERPLTKAVEVGQTVTITGDPNAASSAATLAKVRGNVQNAADYFGVPTSRMILVDYCAIPRFNNVGCYPDVGGFEGYPESIIEHTAALREMGVTALPYWLCHDIGTETTSEILYQAASRYEPVSDVDDGFPNRADTTVPISGPKYKGSPQHPFAASELTRNLASFVSLFGWSGLYFDSHVGAPGERYRNFGTFIDADERGDTVKSSDAWLGVVDAMRDAATGSGIGAPVFDGYEALTVNGSEITAGTTPYALTDADGTPLAVRAECFLEVAPGQLATSGADVLTVVTEIECHGGQAGESFVATGGGAEVLMIGDDEVEVGWPVRFDDDLVLTSENPAWNSLDRWDITPHKTNFPLTFRSLPFPCSIGTAIGGRTQAFNLTDYYPNPFNRRDSTGDFAIGNAGAQLVYQYLEWLAGFTPSFIIIQEPDTLELGAVNPAGGQPTYAGRICEAVREYVQWDMIEKVRRYRRQGGHHAWTQAGKLVELWHDQTAAILDFDAAARVVDIFKSDEGALVVVGNLPYADDSTRLVTVDVDGDEFTLPGSTVYELAKDGSETEVPGAIVGGNLTFSASCGPRELRLFEVR